MLAHNMPPALWTPLWEYNHGNLSPPKQGGKCGQGVKGGPAVCLGGAGYRLAGLCTLLNKPSILQSKTIFNPHSGLRRVSTRIFVTLPVGTPLGPYGIAYGRAYVPPVFAAVWPRSYGIAYRTVWVPTVLPTVVPLSLRYCPP